MKYYLLHVFVKLRLCSLDFIDNLLLENQFLKLNMKVLLPLFEDFNYYNQFYQILRFECQVIKIQVVKVVIHHFTMISI